ncbi:transcription factor bHLH162-like isoform X2 [Rutidosis leptorrhynchoides]|uniref:transcription factor bHLH162-like isoform X2 n=1 Tax=Rutidosis leptorrhynchoides TaxID=125765 RepID=UPI003A98D2FB
MISCLLRYRYLHRYQIEKTFDRRMNKCDQSSEKLDRKIVEKNRRIHMKGLCYELNSLIPSSFNQPNKIITQEDRYDQSIAYIEQLRSKIEVMKKKREEALRLVNNDNISDTSYDVRNRQVVVSQSTIDVKEIEGGSQVFLTTKLEPNFSLSEVIRIVEDGGAEVFKGGYTTLGDKVIYTLHAKARFTRIGIDTTGVRKQLQELINPGV